MAEAPDAVESLVLDTDVCSFLLKRDTRAELYRPDLQGRRLCLSFQTVAELYRWAEERNWGEERRRRLEETLRNYVVLPLNPPLATHNANHFAGIPGLVLISHAPRGV